MTLTDTGEHVPTIWVTHDTSCCFTDALKSVNDRADIKAYVFIIYGHCLYTLLHFIGVLTLNYSELSICFTMFDYSDTYKLLHHIVLTTLPRILFTQDLLFWRWLPKFMEWTSKLSRDMVGQLGADLNKHAQQEKVKETEWRWTTWWYICDPQFLCIH